MEAFHLLTLGMAIIVFLAFFRRGTTTRRHPRTIRVSDPAIARSALIDHADVFANRPLPPFPAGRPVIHSISSFPYGPLWRAVRSNLTAGIHHRSRLGFLPPLEQETIEALIATLAAKAGGGDVVVRDIFHSVIFGMAARLCFGDGMDERDLGTMLQTQREFLKSIAMAKTSERSWLTRLLHWRQRRARARGGIFDRVLEVFIPTIVVARQRWSSNQEGNGFQSYVDSLLELHVPNEDDDEHAQRLLTDKEIAFLVWEFLGGSTFSLLTCLEWTLAHLAMEPEIQNKLHRDVAADAELKDMADELGLPYLHAVVLESLRLHPPTPFAVRDVHAEGIELGKAVVPPEGAHVSFVLGAIGRDGKVWTNPDEFRPERFLEGGEGEGVSLVPRSKQEIKMMPFGAGRRHCPGVIMGMAHIKCFLAELVRKFEWAPPAEGGGNDFTEVDGFRKMMKTPLRVCITPRSQN